MSEKETEKKKKSSEKRYFWFKCTEDFFDKKTLKYLKRLPDGYHLIYLYQKLILMSLKTEGYINLLGIYDDPIEELALMLDIDTMEEMTTLKLLLNSLTKLHEIEAFEDGSIYLIGIQPLIGSEGSSAERVRKFREKKKLELLQNKKEESLLLGTSESGNFDTLQCNNEVTNEDTLQCNGEVTFLSRRERDRYRDRERDRNR